jgi:DNA-binding LacI/PurR family transcriptional regulator
VLKGHGIAWSSALERVGLDPHPDWQLPAGDSLDVPRVRVELERLLAQRTRPTALFCGVVPATVAALTALDELGLRVPEDIAVVGTADQQWRPLIPRRVPVVVLDSYKLGAGAAKLLDELISRGQVTDDTEVIVGVDLDEPASAD